jgi:uncharacterized protein (DUF488 family)
MRILLAEARRYYTSLRGDDEVGEEREAITIYTLGHSTRSLEELLAMLDGAGVTRLVDVRRHPGSRRHPQFSRDSLAEALGRHGIDYVWAEALGGRRKPRKDTRHRAFRVASFAAYADYMETEAFQRAMAALLEGAARAPTAVMCAEARPEQCHRRLISDWLTVHGVRVMHLMTPTRAVAHALPPFARVERGALVYDGGQLPLG